LEELTRRIGKEAIPTLQLFLSDPKVEVRHRAAHLLGTLEDKSGLEQMRKDLNELAPDNGRTLPADPNLDERTRKRIENERNSNLVEALWVSKVLAELGDYRGYDLASELAFKGPLGVQRSQAVQVLLEIAKADDATLRKEGKNPVAMLCKIAAEGKDSNAFHILIGGAEKLDPNKSVPILEAAKNTTNLPQLDRKSADIALQKVRNAAAKSRKDANEPNFIE
jgi:HEAT repeat protein